MRGSKRHAWWWAAQPQAWVLLVACLITFGGFSSSFVLPERPAASHTIPKQLAEHFDVPAVISPVPRPHPDCTSQACLAVTFDDGPDGQYTPIILDTLARHGVRATFFVTGLHAELHPDLIRREFEEGHEIGNHTWAHADLTTLGPSQIQEEVIRTQQVIVNAGVPAPKLFRPPYGAVNEVVIANVPLTIVRWNIDPEDWKVRHPQNIIEHTNLMAKPGGMIILHDTEQYTAEALDSMLQQLGGTYQFVTASELMSLPPGQRGQYFGR